MADNLSDVLDPLSMNKCKLYTTFIWCYVLFVYIVFCNFEGLILLFSFAMILLFAMISLCYPVQVKFLMFPMSFRRYIMESKIIIACRGPQKVRESGAKLTFRQQIPGALLLSNLFPLILLISLSEVLYTPILNLEQLDTYEGTIEKVIGGVRGVRPKLWLKTENGKTIKFHHIGNRAEAKYLKGLEREESIKIWSQHYWGLTPGSSMRFAYQLQHNDLYIKKYDKNIHLQNAKKMKMFFFSLLSYFVMSMVYLSLKGNSYIKQEPTTSK